MERDDRRYGGVDCGRRLCKKNKRFVLLVVSSAGEKQHSRL